MNNAPLTIVIPIHNEVTRLPGALEQLDTLAGLGYQFDCILVENGSQDGTYRLACELAQGRPWLQVLQVHSRGKGLALRAGVLAAGGEFIYTADVDFSTPLPELFAFVRASRGQDVVIGSRELDRTTTRTTIKRRVIGRVFHALVGWLAPGISDTQCGFKFYRRAAALALFGESRLTGMALDVELLYLARRRGLRVKEIPVVWAHDPDSRVKLVADSLSMLVDVFRIPFIHALPVGAKLPV